MPCQKFTRMPGNLGVEDDVARPVGSGIKPAKEHPSMPTCGEKGNR